MLQQENERAAQLFESDHPIPAEFDTRCPHIAERLRAAVKAGADKVRQGCDPEQADLELRAGLREFVLSNIGACSPSKTLQ